MVSRSNRAIVPPPSTIKKCDLKSNFDIPVSGVQRSQRTFLSARTSSELMMSQLNRYRQERDFLQYLARIALERKGRAAVGITPDDYTAVYSLPTNSKAPTYGPCLIWRRGLTSDGYGHISQNGRKMLAHRLVYEMTRGSIPDNMHVLHMCNRRSCIQPAHLYAGTPQENAEDRKAKTESFFMTESMFEKLNRQAAECPNHIWSEPFHTQLSHRPQPEYECNFVVPAGDGWCVKPAFNRNEEQAFGGFCTKCKDLPPPNKPKPKTDSRIST